MKISTLKFDRMIDKIDFLCYNKYRRFGNSILYNK